MSEKKYDPSRRADESENVNPPSVMQTSLDAQNFKDQGSIDAGNEKEDCTQNLKAVSPESSVVISEEQASEMDYDCDKSSSPKTGVEPDTSNTEPSPSTSAYDCTHERVPSDGTPMPTTSKGSLFLRKRLSNLSTIISESDCSSASSEDKKDMVREKFMKYRGHLLPGAGTSKPWNTKLESQRLKRGKTISSPALACDLGNSSISPKFVKDLRDLTSFSSFDSPEESDKNWKYEDLEGHSSSDLVGGISNLEINDMVPSSSEESGGSAATLPITEVLSETSTSGVISPATKKKVSVFNPETGENVDKVLEDDFNKEESQKDMLPQGRIGNVSVSPSKRKAETSEDDSSPTSIQASYFPGISSESVPKRPVKKGKLSSELKFEKWDTIFVEIVTKQSLVDYMKQILSPEKKYEDNVKETVSPVKRKAEDSDTESAGCSFKESVQSESQKPTSKRTKLESETRVSDVTCDGDDNSENKDEKKKEN